MKHLRLSIAFLLSPIIVSVIVTFIHLFRFDSESEMIFLNLLFRSFLIYLTTIFFGIPIYYFFKLLNLKNAITSVINGGIVGLMTAFLINKLFPLPTRIYSSMELFDYLTYFIAGIIGGLIFWLIRYGLKFKESSITKLQ